MTENSWPRADSGLGSASRVIRVLEPVRLVSEAGAAFALLPVPSLSVGGGISVDIEILSPDHLVRYLDRPLAEGTVGRVASTLKTAAMGPHPELGVPTVQDDDAGLAFLIKGSDPTTVLLEVLVVQDQEQEVVDHDGLGFEVPRTTLIDVAHQLEEWVR